MDYLIMPVYLGALDTNALGQIIFKASEMPEWKEEEKDVVSGCGSFGRRGTTGILTRIGIESPCIGLTVFL